MKYISTRDKGHMPEKINSAEAIKRGLAPDGRHGQGDPQRARPRRRSLPSRIHPDDGHRFHKLAFRAQLQRTGGKDPLALP